MGKVPILIGFMIGILPEKNKKELEVVKIDGLALFSDKTKYIMRTLVPITVFFRACTQVLNYIGAFVMK